MKKQWVVVGGVIITLASIGATIYIATGKPEIASQKVTTPITDSTASQTKRLIWEDPAGFTFEYPEGVVIDKHDEDQENYAHVELTHSAHPGKIIVWATDLPINKKGSVIQTVDEWVDSTTEFVFANTLDSTLGGETAKKVLLSSSNQLIVGTLYDEVLWYVEGTFNESPYWTEAFNTITESFTFNGVDERMTSQNETLDIDDTDTFVSETSVNEEEVIE